VTGLCPCDASRKDTLAHIGRQISYTTIVGTRVNMLLYTAIRQIG
jgi:hypothetical protein